MCCEQPVKECVQPPFRRSTYVEPFEAGAMKNQGQVSRGRKPADVVNQENLQLWKVCYKATKLGVGRKHRRTQIKLGDVHDRRIAHKVAKALVRHARCPLRMVLQGQRSDGVQTLHHGYSESWRWVSVVLSLVPQVPGDRADELGQLRAPFEDRVRPLEAPNRVVDGDIGK